MTFSRLFSQRRAALAVAAASLTALVAGCGMHRTYYSPAPVVVVHHYGSGYGGGYGYGGPRVIHVHHYGGYGGGRIVVHHYH